MDVAAFLKLKDEVEVRRVTPGHENWCQSPSLATVAAAENLSCPASPGLSPSLRSDLDFSTFKGFEVTATLTEPFKGKIDWTGTLVGRDAEAVTLNLKGRLRSLPRVLVAEVRLPSAKREKGDTG